MKTLVMRLAASLVLLVTLSWAQPATAGAPTQLVSADELRARLAAERGQVVVVAFWATWCAPCLKELPELAKLNAAWRERGTKLIAVAMDEPTALAAQVEPFRLRYFPEVDGLLRSETEMDTMVSVVDPAWNEILPTTYIIGRDGKVFKKIQGIKPYAELEALLVAALDAAP